MRMNIRGQNLEVTQALKDYVEKKLSKLERYFDTPPTSEAQVTLSVNKDIHNVEVTIPMPSLLLRAEERNSDMYSSIDLVLDKLERQIRKHKTKVNRKFRQEGSLRSLFKDNFETSAPSIPVHDEEDDIEVVRTKRFTLKPMDVEEAILQMNMIGHNFFVFANMDSDEVNVVYKRSDGRYGLIEPAK
ncbi:ribosomal subunit interface protein [Xylanibacillus composti]|uniref:Ribosome hibernation promoting factor n=1 Tax=Xylanibacillus composti TaxID=1572762 RepID=A0A8J4M3D6_9BACL|nr:ribosome-associated translation inhibitor RaiA [Xylanibacillus composti]GIQ69995.1 ribosomal subunit interface protein [Xylanibacillus composti]